MTKEKFKEVFEIFVVSFKFEKQISFKTFKRICDSVLG
jgi:hypothetical protein